MKQSCALLIFQLYKVRSDRMHPNDWIQLFLKVVQRRKSKGSAGQQGFSIKASALFSLDHVSVWPKYPLPLMSASGATTAMGCPEYAESFRLPSIGHQLRSQQIVRHVVVAYWGILDAVRSPIGPLTRPAEAYNLWHFDRRYAWNVGMKVWNHRLKTEIEFMGIYSSIPMTLFLVFIQFRPLADIRQFNKFNYTSSYNNEASVNSKCTYLSPMFWADDWFTYCYNSPAAFHSRPFIPSVRDTWKSKRLCWTGGG